MRLEPVQRCANYREWGGIWECARRHQLLCIVCGGWIPEHEAIVDRDGPAFRAYSHPHHTADEIRAAEERIDG